MVSFKTFSTGIALFDSSWRIWNWVRGLNAGLSQASWASPQLQGAVRGPTESDRLRLDCETWVRVVRAHLRAATSIVTRQPALPAWGKDPSRWDTESARWEWHDSVITLRDVAEGHDWWIWLQDNGLGRSEGVEVSVIRVTGKGEGTQHEISRILMGCWCVTEPVRNQTLSTKFYCGWLFFWKEENSV